MSADDERVTLRPGPWSSIALLVVCASFVAIGVWLAPAEGLPAYLSAGFFAVGIPVAIIQLLPNSTYLELEPHGFTFCSLFRRTTIAWLDVEEFIVCKLQQHGMSVRSSVGFNFATSYERARTGRLIAKAVASCEGALPDTYGMRAEDLASLMNRYLLKARSRASH